MRSMACDNIKSMGHDIDSNREHTSVTHMIISQPHHEPCRSVPLQGKKTSRLRPLSPTRDGDEYNAVTAAPLTGAAVAAATRLSPHEWTGVVKYVAQYLTAAEVKALRLVGSRELNLSEPSLTCHLQLRMDKAPFFSSTDSSGFDEDRARKWLTNRHRLVINDVNASICPDRVAHMLSHGYLDSISQLVVFDCHAHKSIIAQLSQLTSLESLVLADHETSDQGEQGQVLDDLESIVASVGNLQALKHLDIEFDCTIHGSRLSILKNLKGLEHLRLRGFDLSGDGLNHMRELVTLESLHLCHGNFYSSPSDDIREEDLSNLMGLINLKHVHLEGFDGLSDIGLKPFCTPYASVERLILKHCQDLSEDCLSSIGRMRHLTSLHLVHSAYDDAPVFNRESLRQLNAMTKLESLSLFYVLEDLSDLSALGGLTSLETLNIALEDDGIDLEDLNHLCHSILPAFTSLRTLRIFSEEGKTHQYHLGQLRVEFAAFNFGDLVYLE